jgi:hypothetical protein
MAALSFFPVSSMLVYLLAEHELDIVLADRLSMPPQSIDLPAFDQSPHKISAWNRLLDDDLDHLIPR